MSQLSLKIILTLFELKLIKLDIFDDALRIHLKNYYLQKCIKY